MKATTLLKYVTIDKEEVRVKLDMIKQKPKQRVQTHYDRMDKLFAKGKLEDVEQRSFLSYLRPKIKKICVMKDLIRQYGCYIECCFGGEMGVNKAW